MDEGGGDGTPGLFEVRTGSSNGASSDDDGGKDEPLRLGGMALRNGLLIHGPSSWAVAARAADGSIEVASGPKPDFGGNRFAKVPLMRGPLRLAEAFAVIPLARRGAPSSRLPFEDSKVLAAGAVTAAVSALIRGGAERRGPVREGVIGVIGLAPALVALGSSELASYHAVEHKSIGGYEQGRDPAGVPKEHQRCGSNLIVPMLVFSTLGQLVVNRLLDRPGRVAQSLAGVAGVSLSVETFVFAEKNPESPVGRAVHWAGDTIQRLFATREPSDEQMEIGVAALDAVLKAEQGESR